MSGTGSRGHELVDLKWPAGCQLMITEVFINDSEVQPKRECYHTY